MLLAHRIVLSAGSEYMCRLLSDGRGVELAVPLELPHMNHDVLVAVVEYLYCGSCEVDGADETLLKEISRAAEILGVAGLKEAATVALQARPALVRRRCSHRTYLIKRR